LYPATLIENRFMNMKIAENGFEVIPIEFKDEIKKKIFYNILGKINDEIRLLSQQELTQGVWDYSLKKGPRSNFFNSSFRKRFTLFFASKTPFLFNQIYQVKRLIAEFFLK
jgi:hypothetical protein